MIARPVAFLLLSATLALTSGCEGPCDELATRTCRRVGEADKLCVQLRAIAAQPHHGDERACKAGNDFLHELQKSR